jgi:cytochrome c oxidase subunit IV
MYERVISIKTYATVFGLLLLLTATTVAANRIDLGPFNTVLALGIAAVKAMLIALYFMHLRHSSGLTRVVVLAGLLWLGILLVGAMDDYLTRGWLAVPGR